MPIQLKGNWTEGYVLDRHVISSEFVGQDAFGNDVFDTVRTELGELVYRMKYNGHHDTTDEIVKIATPFLTEWLKDKNVNSVIQVPPSNYRDFQPVYRLAEALAKQLHTFYVPNVLDKVSNLQSKNMPRENKSIKGTIKLCRKPVRECNILLVDDLYSTGATAMECTRILQTEPLVKNVYFLAITKTK